MADLTPVTVDEKEIFQYSETIAASGTRTVTFDTENTFVDKDIQVVVTTPAAAAPELEVTDSTTELTMGSASAGYYYPTGTVSGNVSVDTAGWITTGNKAVSDSGVQVGKVAQSTMTSGGETVDSGDEIIPDVSNSQTVTITAGYEGQRTIVVGPMEDGQEAEVTSPDAEISSLTYTANDTTHKFAITGSQTISAPTVDTAGVISATKGTKNAGTASVDATVDQVTVGVTPSSTNVTVTPVISRTAKGGTDTYVDAASGAATTTKPASGAYVAVDAAAVSASATVTGKVSAAGYGNTEHYQADSATTITAGSTDAATAYVPITAGTVQSGTATISTVTHTYDSTNDRFDVEGTASVSAPTASTAGYVGNNVGTLSAHADGATVDAHVAKIAIAADLPASGGTAKPVISKNVATNASGVGTATTTQPSSGYYVAVQSAADTSTVTATAAVTSAGYGTTTSGQYTTTSDTLTVGAEQSDVTYIPLGAATLANEATSGESYVDLSSTGPVIPSNGYLHINAGYIPNTRISLARLVPDDATLTESTGADYILASESAYDSDGKLIVGTIPTYSGSYSVA